MRDQLETQVHELGKSISLNLSFFGYRTAKNEFNFQQLLIDKYAASESITGEIKMMP